MQHILPTSNGCPRTVFLRGRGRAGKILEPGMELVLVLQGGCHEKEGAEDFE